jgi:hypothetical protein
VIDSFEIIFALVGGAITISALADRRKTLDGLQRGLRSFLKILPAMLGTLALISLTMAAFTPHQIESVLSGGGPFSFISALLLGSIALLPGFIAFPLAGLLRGFGATTPVLAAFITTLMMVGVATLPLEARFFGWRVAIIRNILAFIGAVLVALLMGAVLS